MDLTVLSGQLGKYLDMPSSLPPLELWKPELSGDIDMLIKANGVWLHEGQEIKREKLVRLFSTILKKEGKDYFLVTPVEKWRLKVDDQPFVAVLMHVIERGGKQVVQMITNTGDELELDNEHILVTDSHESPRVLVRSDMYARLSRNVYYALAELAEEKEDGFYIKSNGLDFKIG